MELTDSVTYGLKYKRNLGNYESADVFFSISTDVRDGETVDEAKNRAVAKVDGWVEARVLEVDADAAKRR